MGINYPMAYVTSPGKVEFRERELPHVGPRDVLIETKAAAICGSDLHIFKGKHPSASLPVSIGHEIAGKVIDVGSEVSSHSPGDRVTVEPVLACGTCEECRRGSYHLCRNISFQYRRGQGAFAPYYMALEDRVFHIPDEISYAEGALVEPLSVALHAVKTSGLRLGHSSAIFGAGAIGLLVLCLARLASGGKTFITDISEYRLKVAASLGAYRTIDNRQDDVIHVIGEATGHAGVDRSFEAVGVEATLIQALESLKKGGRATVLGIFENPQACLPVNLFIQKEITLGGSQGYNWDFQDAISLLAQRALDLKPLITHRIPLERLHEGFALLTSPGNQAIKVVVEMNDSPPH